MASVGGVGGQDAGSAGLGVKLFKIANDRSKQAVQLLDAASKTSQQIQAQSVASSSSGGGQLNKIV